MNHKRISNVFIIVLSIYNIELKQKQPTLYRMFEPAVLQHGPHLLMDHHILQILQRWVLTHLLLKREHVLMYRA